VTLFHTISVPCFPLTNTVCMRVFPCPGGTHCPLFKSEAGVVHNIGVQPSVNPVDRLVQSASGKMKSVRDCFMNNA